MLQLREKASHAKSEAGGLAPLAHGVLECQKEEQRRASELAALKRYGITSFWFNSQYARLSLLPSRRMVLHHFCVNSQHAHEHNIRVRWLHEPALVVSRCHFCKHVPSSKCMHQHTLLHVLVLSNAISYHLCTLT